MARRSAKPRGGELAARVRAAAAYADLTRVEFGQAIGFSRETVSALFSGEKTPDETLRARIAAVCGVPDWFLQAGFNPPTAIADATLYDRVGVLEQRIADILAAPHHGSQVSEVSDDVTAALKGEAQASTGQGSAGNGGTAGDRPATARAPSEGTRRSERRRAL